MKKILTNGLNTLFYISIVVSCNTSPTSKIQGVYEVDKDSLKKTLNSKMEGESAFAVGLLNVALENAVIEFRIKGDSINGIFFLAGDMTLVESEIIERNDSLVVKTAESEAYLIPTESGISFKISGSEMALDLNKTDRTELSSDSKKAIEIQKIAIQEKEDFEQNLGRWQEGYYVDEFGDKTGEGYVYSIIRGSSENSISMENEVYVKALLQNQKLYFEIYNNSLKMKESFPDSKFGTMKMKFPDGSVKSEQIFFFDNGFSESGDKPILYDFLSRSDGIVKVFVDLSTASDFYSDKYQFAIEKNNLFEMLNKI